MFPSMNVVAALPWRLIGMGALAAGLSAGGCELGERRISARWDAEKLTETQAVTQQVEHVAVVTAQQSTINQEISNEFQTAKAAIAADRQHLLARVPQRVRVYATGHHRTVPGFPELAARVQPPPTLMVVEFQRWYREQARAFAVD